MKNKTNFADSFINFQKKTPDFVATKKTRVEHP